jgi:hypothetical protein
VRHAVIHRLDPSLGNQICDYCMSIVTDTLSSIFPISAVIPRALLLDVLAKLVVGIETKARQSSAVVSFATKVSAPEQSSSR